MPKNLFTCGLAALLVWCALAICNPASATTYYVRTDGGNASQCDGTANAPASAAPHCAWSHPSYALPLGDAQYGNKLPTPRIKSGDTLVIGAGSYMIGLGAPSVGSSCTQSSAWECEIANVPSGLDSTHPTTITGDCSAPPQLWSTQRNDSIFDIENVHDVAIKCMELTDHANCIVYYVPTANTGGVTACNRNSYPYGSWGDTGIYAADVTNLTLDQLNIHGMADYGVLAGRLAGTTKVTNVTIQANGWGGWNGDLGGNDHSSSNSGNLNFDHLTIAWNGCSEAYPNTTIVGCWGQNEGGYGDGLGEAWTGGNWTFTNSSFYHNASDGLDLLYANGTGTITLKNIYAGFSAGNQIKTSGPASLQDSIVDGYCNDWAGFPIAGDGKSGTSGTMCRAMGTAVVMQFVNTTNETVSLAYNTITGNGDTLFVGGSDDVAPTSSDVTTFSNNIWLGQNSAVRSGDVTALDWYSDGTYKGTVNYQNNIVWNVRYGTCPAGNICKDPKLTNETLSAFNAKLLAGSPAIQAAKGGPALTTDYYGNARVTPTSIGAVEYGSTGSGGGAPPPPIVPPRAPGHPGCKWRFCNRVMGGAGERAYPTGTYRAPPAYTAPAKPYTPRTPYSTAADRDRL